MKNRRLDMKDPVLNAVSNHVHLLGAEALDLTLDIEEAVCPIFWTLRKPTKPEQTGSGVFVEIKGQYFVFSASHVFDEIGEYQLLMAVKGEERLISFSGERFSTGRGASGTHVDDPIDASVFHIQSEIPESVKKVALKLDDLDSSAEDPYHSMYVMSGFRSKKSKTHGNETNSERESYASIELSLENYDIFSIDRNRQLILAYDDERYVNGEWQKTPVPAGFSGGAIFKIDGLSTMPLFIRSSMPKPLLSSIIIEHKRGRDNKPGILVGTKISTHLALVQKYLPEIM
ncbi:hypothetical protein DYB15_17760 [Vibrio cholerae]|nr:hypothetical protein [Vibrio cholerae]TXZ58494.1 hypothetical protein FXE56_01755 [Vibrio cholerae]GHW86331.1 hypothetical protein VCSRO59_3549 [Vibrio cholerae]HDZ3704652.1 hypothetical protein [Vibrio cholerae]